MRLCVALVFVLIARARVAVAVSGGTPRLMLGRSEGVAARQSGGLSQTHRRSARRELYAFASARVSGVQYRMSQTFPQRV